VNDSQFEMGIVSYGDDDVFATMLELEAAFQGVTDDAELRTITRGANAFQYGMVAARVGLTL
jgi:hypothetical protein